MIFRQSCPLRHLWLTFTDRHPDLFCPFCGSSTVHSSGDVTRKATA